MPGRRIPMRKLKEVLRLRLAAGLSNRKIALCTEVSKSAVSKHVARAEELGLSWSRIEPMAEDALEALLYPEQEEEAGGRFVAPDWDEVARELRRKGVTKLLLWQEYEREHGARAYSYSRFCELYAEWKGGIEPVMRFEHVAGEKCFVDYGGVKLDVVDPETGEVREAEVFVAALGASSYTFADVTWSQQSEDFLTSHVRAVEYFGGVPKIFVPDNLKTGVTKANRYEPLINRSYEDLLSHLNAVAIPARAGKARDKAKAENAVQQVERWVIAPLRNELLVGLGGARRAVLERLEKLNDRGFQKMAGSRASLYAELEKPALQPLPKTRWVPCEWKELKVHIDYHVEVDGYYFSVPYRLVGRTMDVKVTPMLVEIYHKSRPVTTHLRTSQRWSTKAEHMPRSHREHLRCSPPQIISRARRIGPHVIELIEQLLSSKIHPEQGYRPSLGIVRLANRYGDERLDAACRRALAYSAVSYRSVKSILERGLDGLDDEEDEQPSPVEHDNIRGREAYEEGGRAC